MAHSLSSQSSAGEDYNLFYIDNRLATFINLTVLASETVLTDTLIVIDSVHTVLHPWLLLLTARLETLVDVDLAILPFKPFKQFAIRTRVV